MALIYFYLFSTGTIVIRRTIKPALNPKPRPLSSAIQSGVGGELGAVEGGGVFGGNAAELRGHPVSFVLGLRAAGVVCGRHHRNPVKVRSRTLRIRHRISAFHAGIAFRHGRTIMRV